MWWQKKTDVVLLLKYPTLLSTGRVEVYINYSEVHLKLFLNQESSLLIFLVW